jgi:hypothetical protein
MGKVTYNMNKAKHRKTAPALIGNLPGLKNVSGSKNTKWGGM